MPIPILFYSISDGTRVSGLSFVIGYFVASALHAQMNCSAIYELILARNAFNVPYVASVSCVVIIWVNTLRRIMILRKVEVTLKIVRMEQILIQTNWRILVLLIKAQLKWKHSLHNATATRVDIYLKVPYIMSVLPLIHVSSLQTYIFYWCDKFCIKWRMKMSEKLFWQFCLTMNSANSKVLYTNRWSQRVPGKSHSLCRSLYEQKGYDFASRLCITKTCLFKYTENFTTKKKKKKTNEIFR